MPLSKDDVSAIETVAHYTHDEDQAYLMLYGKAAPSTRATRGPPIGGLRSRAMAVWHPGQSGWLPGKRAHRDLCVCVAGEGVFETIPIEADYTVGDMKLWLNFHKVCRRPRPHVAEKGWCE